MLDTAPGDDGDDTAVGAVSFSVFVSVTLTTRAVGTGTVMENFSVKTSFVEVICVESTDDVVVVVPSAAEYEAEALELESAEMVGLAGSASAKVERALSRAAVCRSGAPVCRTWAVTVVFSEGTRILRVAISIEVPIGRAVVSVTAVVCNAMEGV